MMPATWSVFYRPFRTHSDVDCGLLSSKAGKGKQTFYQLIQLLIDEAQVINMQVRLMSDKKLIKHHRKGYAVVQSSLFSLWNAFLSGELTVSKLLRRCSLVYADSVVTSSY